MSLVPVLLNLGIEANEIAGIGDMMVIFIVEITWEYIPGWQWALSDNFH